MRQASTASRNILADVSSSSYSKKKVAQKAGSPPTSIGDEVASDLEVSHLQMRVWR
jgi:hypothetical protein